MRAGPIGDAFLHRSDGREVKAPVHTLHGLRRRARIGHVPDDQVHPIAQVVSLAGREIVQHPHSVAAGQERVAKVRADEAGAACHQEQAHARVSGVGTQHLAQHRAV